ncbi:MAG TPA: SDR family oxidoreductase [Candidatus Binataceae bacterium]|jgi:3-oxoacyl-[acyl-carrier protein] reductase|nr:SDR family oxidoreductase [Candidatus Binataceae bacterium]
MRFKDKVAFITGGGRGIGETYARALAAEGAAVVLAEIDMPAAQGVAASIAEGGARALAVPCDVAEEESVDAAVARAVEHFGGVDILINNAAKHLTEYAGKPTELARAKWRLMLDVNVIGIVNCAAACRSSMRERGGGVIINQSSIAGFDPTTPYGISKLAVRGLVVALAKELAPDGIRVYGIAPGPVDSPSAMADLPPALLDGFINRLQLVKRQGRMADLVGAVLFFCSAEAGFITGETLVIGGGYPLRI